MYLSSLCYKTADYISLGFCHNRCFGDLECWISCYSLTNGMGICTRKRFAGIAIFGQGRAPDHFTSSLHRLLRRHQSPISANQYRLIHCFYGTHVISDKRFLLNLFHIFQHPPTQTPNHTAINNEVWSVLDGSPWCTDYCLGHCVQHPGNLLFFLASIYSSHGCNDELVGDAF